MTHELDDMVKDFLVESHENLDQLDRDLVSLEQDPSSRDTISSIFRTIHTIKGTCGFLGFGKLEHVTHAGESLLSRMRDGELRMNSDVATGLLTLVDAIRSMLAKIDSDGREGDDDFTALVDLMHQLQRGDLPSTSSKPELNYSSPATSPAGSLLGQMLIAEGAATPQDIAAAVHQQELGDPTTLGEILVDDGRTSAGDVAAALNRQQEFRGASRVDSTIRVDVSLLDKLMNRVGELVLARNQIMQSMGERDGTTFLNTCQRLNLITTELQEGVMKTRMQPIDNVWSKFPRVVRDLAITCGKQVRVEMEGRETELDKTIIEAIKDPLTHLVRNSVDHGIERPEVRVAAGKAPEGLLRMRAFHEGGQVNIEIIDDGGGLNLPRIRSKAVERGLVTAEQAARMSDREAAHLIFRPGFSTAEALTSVSGRGVGMDVVKTNVEKIGGTVDIASQPGRGTTIRVKIPLTLAIIPALVVSCGGERYAIPQVSLFELVRLEGEQARQGIERLHNAQVYRLRGKLLPLVDLGRALGLVDRRGDLSDDAIVNIVVLRADDRQFGLVVDAINDTEEIVVKPLGKQFKGVSVFAGATIMGDGNVALILDVVGLAQSAHVVNESRDRCRTDQAHAMHEQSVAGQPLLVVGVGESRLALPLSSVARLEEIRRSAVEYSDLHPVVQYRGDVLRLIDLAPTLGLTGTPDLERPLQVVVYSHAGRSVGFVVDRIIDTVHSAKVVNQSACTPGLAGTLVINDRVTDLIDPLALVRRVDPNFFANCAVV